jgi:hypothetical protein
VGVWYIMSTTLANAAAEVSRLKTEIETHKSTFPDYARRSTDIEYELKKKHYEAKLAHLQIQLHNAEMVHQYAVYAETPPVPYYPKGGKKSRKSHNSKKSRKSKRSHTTYKRSKRSRR